MALDKKQASTTTRILIGIVALIVVLSFLPWNSIGLIGSGNGTTDSAGQLDAIAAQYGSTVSMFEQQLASDPTSYTVLVNLGNTYFDWAYDVQQVQPEGQAYDRPMWVSASTFYSRAVEQQGGNPAVSTDFAVTLYYGGDLNGAIAAIEDAIAADSEFSTAYFNAAIFYRSASRLGDAAAAASRFLELDPTGQTGNVQLAQEIIAEGASSPVTAPETPSVETSPSTEETSAQ